MLFKIFLKMWQQFFLPAKLSKWLSQLLFQNSLVCCFAFRTRFYRRKQPSNQCKYSVTRHNEKNVGKQVKDMSCDFIGILPV